jgi:hypothetical protein
VPLLRKIAILSLFYGPERGIIRSNL